MLDAILFRCPRCKSAPGSPCTTAGNRSHDERLLCARGELPEPPAPGPMVIQARAPRPLPTRRKHGPRRFVGPASFSTFKEDRLHEVSPDEMLLPAVRRQRDELLVARGFASYGKYLNSKEWRLKSGWARAWGQCFVCGSEEELNLHHIRYTNITMEQPDDCIILCRIHHRAVHRLHVDHIVPLDRAHLVARRKWDQAHA